MEGIVDRRCKRTCDTYSLFDKLTVDKLTGLTLLNENLPHISMSDTSQDVDGGENRKHTASTVRYYCPLCDVTFTDDRKMRDHYQTDWHVYNLNLSRQHCDRLSEQDFERQLDTFGFESSSSSTSSSSAEDEEEDDEAPEEDNDMEKGESLIKFKDDDEDARYSPIDGTTSSNVIRGPKTTLEDLEAFAEASRRHRIFFRNKNSEIVALYRCLLYSKHDRPDSVHELLRRVTHLRESKRWAILLYSGGSFAGGIFDERKEVVHKTLKRYTVRKKQGGGQSACDGRGNAPKSAGASLRRYGEMAIRKEISDLLHTTWRAELLSCQLILIWSPKSQLGVFFPPNQTSLLPPSTQPTFTRQDPRIRRIPLMVRDITYSQVKNLHGQLSTYEVYDGEAEVPFLKQTPRKQVRTLSENGQHILQESESGRLIMTSVPKPESETVEEKKQSKKENKSQKMKKKRDPGEDEREEGDCQSLQKINNDMNDLEVTPSLTPLPPMDTAWRDRVLIAVACGDQETLDSLLEKKRADEGTEAVTLSINLLLAGGSTFLHVVAGGTYPQLVAPLMEAGCDPAVADNKGQTAYQKAVKCSNKLMTSVFRKFMFDFPDKFDYNAAKIPAPLDPVKEAEKKARDSERKRALLKQKRAREKVKKAEERGQQAEQAQKDRFLALSDREKRALATERRMMDQAKSEGRSVPVFNRCFKCGADISGQIPFEYAEFRFCTIVCLRQHRTQTTLAASSLKPR